MSMTEIEWWEDDLRSMRAKGYNKPSSPYHWKYRNAQKSLAHLRSKAKLARAHRRERAGENPMTDTQKRWLWTGALGTVLGVTIGAIAYASGKATGASECQSKSQVLNLPGAGVFQNTYPPGSTIAVSLPAGATWGSAGMQIMTGSFNLLAVPTSGNASAQIVYNGGGGKVVATWTDSTGAPQQTELDFTG
jgi:hypothetical protein